MSESQKHQAKMVAVWDFPTRLFHWLLVIAFAFLVTTGNIGGDWILWHIRVAYVVSGLILFRILWGFVGSYHARFVNFVKSPISSVKHLVAMARGDAPSFLGHNPAGAIVVIIFLLAFTTQFLAGSVITDDILWYGPFYNWVSESLSSLGTRIHYQMEWILIGLVTMHILAVLYHQFRLKEKLIQGMIHGKKSGDSQAPKVSTNYIALAIILVICAVWVGWLWSLPI